MNGGYSPFDLDAFSNGYQQQQHQQQQQQSPQQQQQATYHLQGIPQPCYEGYDPTTSIVAAPGLFDSSRLYNSTGHPHTVLQPAPSEDVFLEPDPLTNAVEHRHQHQSWTTTTSTATTVPATAATTDHHHHHLEAFANTSFGEPSVDDVILASEPLSLSGMLTPVPLHPAPQNVRKISNPDEWLDSISIAVSGVSLEPMTGREIVERVQNRTTDVRRRYLPCVDFLVSCQQELRAGLAAATQRRVVGHRYRNSLTPRQFYQRYLEPLGTKFLQKNIGDMDIQNLNQACAEIKQLCANAKKVEYQGCEGMKNAYLGGMKDGESWGLRKWLSKHGGALAICNDLECILTAVQKLDRNAENTRKLAERLRPIAKRCFDRLRRDVPDSYQEQSSAHPYLPFFHRLECALRGVSNFDPEDDDVICIDDDDEVEEIKSKASLPAKVQSSPSTTSKRKADDCSQGDNTKRMKPNFTGEGGHAMTPQLQAQGPLQIGKIGDDSDDDSDIEVVGVSGPGRKGIIAPPQPAAAAVATAPAAVAAAPPPPAVAKKKSFQPLRCTRCTMLNAATSNRCCMCDQAFDQIGSYQVEEDTYDDTESFSDFAEIPGMEEATATLAAEFWSGVSEMDKAMTAQGSSAATISTATEDSSSMTADEMMEKIENLAVLFETNQQHRVLPRKVDNSCFWNAPAQYAKALRMFAAILGMRDSQPFLEPVNEVDLLAAGKPLYGDFIRRPLCFRDIVVALQGDGNLNVEDLESWNMWRGKDLLQAIDLVFLNSLAYNGKEKTQQRSRTNSLRKYLWDNINSTITSALGTNPGSRKQCLPTRRGESSGFVIRKHPASPVHNLYY